MRTLLNVFALLLIPQICTAQPTMALWVDDGGVLVDDYDVLPAIMFDVVVTLDSDASQVGLVSWGMTRLEVAAPGLVALGMTASIGSCGFNPEACFEGNYTILVAGCHPPGDRIPVARFRFADFAGVVGADVVAVIGPNASGGIPGSSGFMDCADQVIAAPMGGSSGGTTSSGVTWPAGGLILNPTRPIPVHASGVSMLKARY